MYWNMYHHNASSAQVAAGRAETKALNIQEHLNILEDKIDSLALICQAQWELIRDNTGLKEGDIEAKAQEIDMRDGKEDKKMGRKERLCSECQRPLHKRHDRCLYCGNALDNKHIYDV